MQCRRGIIARVSLRLFAWLILGLLPQASEREVVLCEQPGWRQEEESLVAALHVYTRDLNLALLTVPESASTTDDEQLRRAQNRCGPNVAMVIWYGRDLGNPSLNVLACADKSLRKEPLEPRDDLVLASQTLALKLRGLLAVTGASPDAPAPPKPADTAKPAAVPDVATPVAPTSQEPVAPARPVRINPAPAPRPSPAATGPDISAGFLAQSAPDGTWLRPGALLRGTLPFARDRLAVVGDVGFLRTTNATAGPPRITLNEFSMTVAIPLRLHLGPEVFSVGPLLGGHIYWVGAHAPGGQSDQSATASWSVGALATARFKVTKRWGLLLSLAGRGLFPRRIFQVAGQPSPAIGYFDIDAAVGVSYRWGGDDAP